MALWFFDLIGARAGGGESRCLSTFMSLHGNRMRMRGKKKQDEDKNYQEQPQKATVDENKKLWKAKTKKLQRTTQKYQRMRTIKCWGRGSFWVCFWVKGFQDVLWVDPNIPTGSPTADSFDVLLFHYVEGRILMVLVVPNKTTCSFYCWCPQVWNPKKLVIQVSARA